MKRIIRSIEKALCELYNIDLSYNAEDFVLAPEKGSGKSALLIQSNPDELSVGIYFGEQARQDFPEGTRAEDPSVHPLPSFSVVAEEVSHFHYLIFHSQYGRALSRLELEVQGNVDAFLVAYFATSQKFEDLFERFFANFHLDPRLSEEEESRYADANRIASDFLKSFRGRLETEGAFKQLREFYRLSLTEKISRSQAA